LPDDVGNRIGQYCAYDPENPIQYKDDDGQIERCKETAEQAKQKKALEDEVKKLVKKLNKPGAAPPVDTDDIIAKVRQMKVEEDKTEESKKPGPVIIEGTEEAHEIPGYYKLTINDSNFFWGKKAEGTSKNGLFEMIGQDEDLGSWVGYYQPGNKREPIRYTDEPDE